MWEGPVRPDCFDNQLPEQSGRKGPFHIARRDARAISSYLGRHFFFL